MIWNLQLVFDCADPDAVMVFWGPTLGYEGESVWTDAAALREWRKGFPQFDGRGRIDDGTARRMPIYIQKVPEAKERRNRIELELVAPREHADTVVRGALERGASEHDATLRDPEGNEFSVHPAETSEVWLRTLRFDALDPDRMLGFWAEATGYAARGARLEPPPARIESGSLVVDGRPIDHPSASWALGIVNEPAAMADRVVLDLQPGIEFRKVDEPKTIKNRLHLDLRSTDKGAELARLEELGASVVRMTPPDDCVLRDPEGNEFCLG